jgi:hypothetical protein
MKNPDLIEEIIQKGTQMARKVAVETVAEASRAIGLRRKKS